MPTITAEIVAGFARHILTTIGGGVATAGYVDGNDFSIAVGALSTLIGVGWSIYQKRSAAKKAG
jgi:hypothetical protein